LAFNYVKLSPNLVTLLRQPFRLPIIPLPLTTVNLTSFGFSNYEVTTTLVSRVSLA